MATVGLRIVFLLAVLAPSFAQVRIVAPEWLAGQFADVRGIIEGSTATFGAPFYGDDVMGRLVWGESKTGHNHCREDDYDLPALPTERSADGYSRGQLLTIALVRRGNCSFTTKVRVASKKGAHAVVIVDREDSQLTRRDLHHVIVADDGYGDRVRIPSILVAKDDGARLIAAASHDEVIVELSWDVPTNHVVDMDLWMSAGSRSSMQFLANFAPYRRKLNQVMRFTPHYVVFSMPSGDPGVYNELCTDTSGKFCTEDPDGTGPVTGRDVLEEDVRQLCIHELTRVPRAAPAHLGGQGLIVEYADKYWAYIERLLEECPVADGPPDHHFGTECSERLMREIGLDVDSVRQCASNTRDLKLEHERENTAWSPRALRINGWRYNGMLDVELVTRAICAGFVHKPPECEELLDPRQYGTIDAPTTGHSISLRALALVTCGVLVAAYLSMKMYHRALEMRIQKEIREEVYLEVQTRLGDYSRMPAGPAGTGI